MPVTIDNTLGEFDGLDSISANFTVGSGATALLVPAAFDAAAGAILSSGCTATFNSVAMSQVVTVTAAGGGSSSTIVLFGLVNPASGTHAVAVADNTQGSDIAAGAISFFGSFSSAVAAAFQHSATTDVTGANPVSLAITCGVNDYCSATALTLSGNITSLTPGTQLYIDEGTSGSAFENTAAGAANYSSGPTVTFVCHPAQSVEVIMAGIAIIAPPDFPDTERLVVINRSAWAGW